MLAMNILFVKLIISLEALALEAEITTLPSLVCQQNSQCQNGGTCMDSSCLCVYGYGGSHCESRTICVSVLIATRQHGVESSWTLGTCKSAETYSKRHSTYTQRCCVVPGQHLLTCDDSAGNGWHGGFIKIWQFGGWGARICEDFTTGHQQRQDIDILGPCYCEHKKGNLSRNGLKCIYNNTYKRFDHCSSNEYCIGPDNPDDAVVFSHDKFCIKGTVSCGVSLGYPDCSYCPLDNTTAEIRGCNGNCQFNSSTHLCEKKNDFLPSYKGSCGSGENVYGSYISLEFAKLACSNDTNCVGVQEERCKKGGLSPSRLCKKGVRSGGYTCIHKKKEYHEQEGLTCLDITLEMDQHEYSWDFGPCTPSHTSYTGMHRTYRYIEKCCIPSGDYLLSCKSKENHQLENQYGWIDSLVKIGRHQFCDDYTGYNTFVSLNIPALTATNRNNFTRGHSSSVALMPYPGSNGCPKNTVFKNSIQSLRKRQVGTCSCEEHCAWDLCRLTVPPKHCLEGTSSQWQWDNFKTAWVAEVNQGPQNDTSTTTRRLEAYATTKVPEILRMELEKQKQADRKIRAIQSAREIVNNVLYISVPLILLLYFAYAWKKVRADPKLYKKCFVITLTLVCSLLATYMTAKQVMSFLENDDATAIHYRRFNLTPKDKYPTFSICFTGSELYWYKAMEIFKIFGVRPSKFEAMLKGEEVFQYDYNYTSMLYNKIPVDLSHLKNIDTGQFAVKMSDILTRLEFVTDEDMTGIRIDSSGQGNDVEKIPMHVGFNTPDSVCFTRTSIDSLNTQRAFDSMAFSNTVLRNDRFKQTDFQIFVHYPQQLLRSFHKPAFKSTVAFWNKPRLNDLKITISKVTILRKRSGSNVPCDEYLEDDDTKFQQQIIDRLECTPPYWRKNVGINSSTRICDSGTKLQATYAFIQKYKDILKSYDSPCIQMEILSKFERGQSGRKEDPQITFLYEEIDYEELENTKNFDFASFVSGVGGFIGIFLGYSILQIPDLIVLMPSLMFNLKRSINKGFLCRMTSRLSLKRSNENKLANQGQTSDQLIPIQKVGTNCNSKGVATLQEDKRMGDRGEGIGFSNTKTVHLEWDTKLSRMNMKIENLQCKLETQIKSLQLKMDATRNSQSINNWFNDQMNKL